jgi:hypothetical protein
MKKSNLVKLLLMSSALLPAYPTHSITLKQKSVANLIYYNSCYDYDVLLAQWFTTAGRDSISRHNTGGHVPGSNSANISRGGFGQHGAHMSISA